MSKSTKVRTVSPVIEADPEVLAFRAQFDEPSPLDQIIRDGAQRMLPVAIEAEVDEFLLAHNDRRDENGNRLVVRNGRQPARKILTGAGPLEVQQPRVPLGERRCEVSGGFRLLPPRLRHRSALATSKISRSLTFSP